MDKTTFLERVLDATRHFSEATRHLENLRLIIPTMPLKNEEHHKTLLKDAERNVAHAKEQLQFTLDSYIDYRITILMRQSR